MNEVDIKNSRIYLRDGKTVQVGAATLTDGISAAGQAVINFATGEVANEGLEVGMWLAPNSTLRPRYFITDITGDAVTVHTNLLAAIPDATRLYRSDWNQIEVEIGEGNLSYSEKAPREYKLSRGRLNRVKNADEEPLEVSIDAIWEYIESNGVDPVSITEALRRSGNASSWISVGEECMPYSLDLAVVYTPDCAELTDPNELLIFPDFRYESIDGDLSAGSLAIPGKCLALKPISARYGS